MCSIRCVKNFLKSLLAFTGGVSLGQVYYYYLLKQIPFPFQLGNVLSLVISVILGVGNAISIQLRCISLLLFPMYCGKPGRGVLKAVILTYIVTGPITNMGLNAREVVRVYACNTQLSFNLTNEKYVSMLGPLSKAVLGIEKNVENVKDAFRTINEVLDPIEVELEGIVEVAQSCMENDFIDDLFRHRHRSEDIEKMFPSTNTSINYELFYQKKLRHRCENQLSRASAVCIQELTKAYTACCDLVPQYAEFALCSPLKEARICDLITDLRQTGADDICDPQPAPGLSEAYIALKRVKKEFVEKLNSIHLQYKISYEKDLLDIQDAAETSDRVTQAFAEKTLIMHHVLTVMNVCMALLFLRIFNAAVVYHDMYLTNIGYDNVYVTGYFRRLDERRRLNEMYTLLPLKKMERSKYIDVYSPSYIESQRSKLILQILKVMLEVVTATTFVMLDRLFYEALDVVRQHAEMEVLQQGTRDLEIEVEGTGILGTMLRKLLEDLNTSSSHHQLSNAACLPRPRQMPHVFFLKIYGGYLWIVILLFVNPYMLRLRRLICSKFYPHREKHRILHLYNDILKKRMKMDRTLRRRAAQTVRVHYLSSETLLSMRIKFPQLLGWLRVLPAARMTCLICGEAEPRNRTQSTRYSWYSCLDPKCPFVYCAECWREAGARCLACEPSLVELSDIDSLTEDEPVY